jgi:pre-mRNA-processing factor 17
MPPQAKCFLPKREIHKWTGHTKGVSTVRFLPGTAHLMASAGLDGKAKLWEVGGQRRLLRTYHGHTKGIRDLNFNRDGSRFVTAGFDRKIRLWDTETGECLLTVSLAREPICVKFHPAEDKQNLFVTGGYDKKITCIDTNTGEVVQEYDRHLGAVNAIEFMDGGRKMVSTSDDKSIRIWEWDIPVDIKYIADPNMHSMPAITQHPNKKWMIFTSMDNSIVTFGGKDRFRQVKKKTFKGHMSAGYACQPDISPDGSYVVSGDGNGFLWVWDWKTQKRFAKFKAHDDVCIGAFWHPFETSKVVTCGWDGVIKLWD